jgi:aryl-alcohol dehydrogenase-like predicted oxidoreductase
VLLPDTDLRVHPLALGASSFGWTLDDDTACSVLDRHRELGGNLVDTADSYAAGRSEALIGSWLRTRKARDETLVSTKIGFNRDHPGLSPQSIVGAVHACLERLGTDRIDLLHFHFDDLAVPLEESLSAVDGLIRAGDVRHLGAANFSADRLIEARVLAANGLPRFVALQTHYNLVHRRPYETSLRPVANGQGLAVLPYFSLAHGFLAGNCRTRSDARLSTTESRTASYLSRRNLRVLGVLDRVAREHDAAPTSIALAWLIAHGAHAPAAGAGHPDQVSALLRAADIRLSASELSDLDQVSA